MPRQVELRDLGLREQHLVRVRDPHVAAPDLQLVRHRLSYCDALMEVSVPTRAAPRPEIAVPPAVSVGHLTKSFRSPTDPHTSLKERAVHGFRPQPHEVFHAVDDVSFDVARGEFLGIVGPNGSGKSTLLKCIAGVYSVDAGRVTVTGRLSPFLEMGGGFKEELNAYENVVVNGTMLGLTKAQIRERMDDIIAFSDIGDFANFKMKNLSSGMKVRLAFSLSIQVDADVLLVDEVLAVGDEAFKNKCLDQFHALKQEGRTLLFVSHSMEAMKQFCDRAVLLDAGRIVSEGDTAEVAEDYRRLNARRPEELDRASRRSSGSTSAGPPPRGPAFADAGEPKTYRPSAVGDSLRRFGQVTLTLAITEFKLHYKHSVLGYVWSLLQPLMFFGVMYAVFSAIIGLGHINHYALYVLSAVVLWMYFAESTSGGVTALVNNENLVRKLRFPRLAIPLAVSLKSLFNLGMNFIAVLAFALISGVAPRMSWLELPLLVLVLAAFTTGVTVLLSIVF